MPKLTTEEQIIVIRMLKKINNAIRDADRGTVPLNNILTTFRDENIPAPLKASVIEHYKEKGWGEAWWHGDGFNLRRSEE